MTSRDTAPTKAEILQNIAEDAQHLSKSLHRSKNPVKRAVGSVLVASRIWRHPMVIAGVSLCALPFLVALLVRAAEFHYRGDSHLVCDDAHVCHCQNSKSSCHAAMARACTHVLSPACDATCHWHPTLPSWHDLGGAATGSSSLRHAAQISYGRCDTCSAEHCHGCATAEECHAADPNGMLCRWEPHSAGAGAGWMASHVLGGVGSGTCKNTCSSTFCGGCSHDEAACRAHATCQYLAETEECHPKCDTGSCHGCRTKDLCYTGLGCAWDEAQDVCTAACRTDLTAHKNGLGCWTCGSQALCDAQSESLETFQPPSHWCTWDDASATCHGRHPQESAETYNKARRRRYFFGDLSNPGTHLEGVQAVEGTIVLEHLSKWSAGGVAQRHGRAGGAGAGAGGDEVMLPRHDATDRQHCTTYFGPLGGRVPGPHECVTRLNRLEILAGTLVVARNPELRVLDLSNLRYIDGDVFMFDNPMLDKILIHPDLHVLGCRVMLKMPKLDHSDFGGPVLHWLESRGKPTGFERSGLKLDLSHTCMERFMQHFPEANFAAEIEKLSAKDIPNLLAAEARLKKKIELANKAAQEEGGDGAVVALEDGNVKIVHGGADFSAMHSAPPDYVS